MTVESQHTDGGSIDWEAKRIELAASRRHEEMRERLQELGRSEQFVRSLAMLHSFSGFERLVAETDRYEREQDGD